MKPIYKQDWFWLVTLPTVFVGLVFVFGLLMRGCVG